MNGIELLIGAVLLLLVIGPILGIAAWVRVNRLQRESFPPSEARGLIARIHALEQKLAETQARLNALAARQVTPDDARVSPRAAEPPSPGPARPPATPAATLSSPPRPAPPVAAATAPPSDHRPMFQSSQEVSAPSADARGLDLETQIAGRWLNRIGLLLVLIAVAYFLKLVIDNRWIGPTGQVALGILGGAGLLVFSHWLLGRGYRYFSEGITGLGAGVLYLSLWAGSSYYRLFSLDIGFFAMIAVTAAIVAIALGRDSQRIAVLALAGGFLTPVLVSTGQDAQVVLFTYVAVLNAGLLAVACRKDWRWLELPAFAFTQIYFWGWYGRFYHDSEPLLRTLAFATLFFAEFSALSVIRARRIGAILEEQAILVLLNGSTFLYATLAILYDAHRWAATFGTLALAAAHLAILRTMPRAQGEQRGPEVTRLLYAGLALTFVTLVIPIRLEGKWMTMAFAMEAAVLMWAGFRERAWQLRASGFVLFGVVVFRLLFMRLAGGTLLLNERFGTMAVTVACFALALYFAREHAGELREIERPYFGILAVGINVVSLWALSAEAYDYFGPQLISDLPAVRMDAWLARQLALSLVWTGYATALMVVGVKRGAALLRWQALALFGVTVAKVFLNDLSVLSGGYRVASSIVLGLMLLAVSFLYQRRMAAQKSEGPR